MEPQSIFSRTFSVLERGLDLRALKHNLIASNIANLETPNYKRFDLMVEKALTAMVEKSQTKVKNELRPGHIPLREVPYEVTTPVQGFEVDKGSGGNGESVDIDKEMASLSENNLMYNALAQILARKFLGLKNAIKEGRG